MKITSKNMKIETDDNASCKNFLFHLKYLESNKKATRNHGDIKTI